MPSCRSRRLPAFVLAAAALAAPAAAQEPAVESPNGKLAFGVAHVDGDTLQALDGSFALPLGERLGVQLDAAAGLFSGDDFAYAGGVQVFWRDPARALVGLEIAYADRPEERALERRYGVASELYRERVTLAGRAGYSDGDRGDGAYFSLDFIFYAIDDLAVRFAGDLAPGEKVDRIGLDLEYQLPARSGLSFFAGGALGEQDFNAIGVGVRYYFDRETRSLKDRQRRQDPRGLSDLLLGLTEREDRPPARRRPPPPNGEG